MDSAEKKQIFVEAEVGFLQSKLALHNRYIHKVLEMLSYPIDHTLTKMCVGEAFF